MLGVKNVTKEKSGDLAGATAQDQRDDVTVCPIVRKEKLSVPASR